MAESTGSWPWQYRPGPEASEKLTKAHKELVEDEADLAELDFTTDDFPVKIKGCVTFSNGSVVEKTPEDVDNDFEVNYNRQLIKLPGFVANCYSVDPCIKAENIRYAKIIGGVQQGVICDDQVLLLSVWKSGRQEIVNAFLRLPGIKETLILASSIFKLIYEGSGKSQMRMTAFTLICSGDALMSSCSVEERDKRELIEFEKSKKKVNNGESSKQHVHNGTLEADSVKDKEDKEDEELKPLKEQRLFFALDKEALSLFEHPLCPKAVADFRFYKEPEENVIDVIYLSNNTGELEIERQQKVFYFKATKKDAEDFDKLSKVLREGKVKPIPKEAFSDLQSFEKYEKDQLPQAKLPNQISSQLPIGENGRPNVFAPPPEQRLPQQQTPQWLNLLSTGSHLNSGDEELQIMWFTTEHELENCIRTNSVPDLSSEFRATNPNDFNRLLTIVEQIRDKLMTHECNIALSLLRGIVSVFRNTFLKDVAHLNELELLKRIYFITE